MPQAEYDPNRTPVTHSSKRPARANAYHELLAQLAADGVPIGQTGGALDVNIKSGGAGAGGTSAADDDDFTAGLTNGTPIQGVYESSPTSVTDGDLGTVGITVNRRVKTSTVLEAGTANFGDADILSLVGDNADLDSGGGVDSHAVVAIGMPAAGGHVIAPGSAAYGLKSDVSRFLGGVPASMLTGTPAAITDNNAHEVLGAAGASTKWAVSAVIVTNSHDTVGTLVTIQDDAAPNKYCQGYAASGGGGFAINFSPAIACGQDNGKINAICGTTGANVYITVAAYKVS